MSSFTVPAVESQHRTANDQPLYASLLRPFEQTSSPSRAAQHEKTPCDWEGCSKTFSRPQDLDRHRRTVHLQDEQHWCLVLDCKRSEFYAGLKRPFPRKDKRDDHMRKMHKHLANLTATESLSLSDTTRPNGIVSPGMSNESSSFNADNCFSDSGSLSFDALSSIDHVFTNDQSFSLAPDPSFGGLTGATEYFGVNDSYQFADNNGLANAPITAAGEVAANDFHVNYELNIFGQHESARTETLDSAVGIIDGSDLPPIDEVNDFNHLFRVDPAAIAGGLNDGGELGPIDRSANHESYVENTGFLEMGDFTGFVGSGGDQPASAGEFREFEGFNDIDWSSF